MRLKSFLSWYLSLQRLFYLLIFCSIHCCLTFLYIIKSLYHWKKTKNTKTKFYAHMSREHPLGQGSHDKYVLDNRCISLTFPSHSQGNQQEEFLLKKLIIYSLIAKFVKLNLTVFYRSVCRQILKKKDFFSSHQGIFFSFII